MGVPKKFMDEIFKFKNDKKNNRQHKGQRWHPNVPICSILQSTGRPSGAISRPRLRRRRRGTGRNSTDGVNLPLPLVRSRGVRRILRLAMVNGDSVRWARDVVGKADIHPCIRADGHSNSDPKNVTKKHHVGRITPRGTNHATWDESRHGGRITPRGTNNDEEVAWNRFKKCLLISLATEKWQKKKVKDQRETRPTSAYARGNFKSATRIRKAAKKNAVLQAAQTSKDALLRHRSIIITRTFANPRNVIQIWWKMLRERRHVSNEDIDCPFRRQRQSWDQFVFFGWLQSAIVPASRVYVKFITLPSCDVLNPSKSSPPPLSLLWQLFRWGKSDETM